MAVFAPAPGRSRTGNQRCKQYASNVSAVAPRKQCKAYIFGPGRPFSIPARNAENPAWPPSACARIIADIDSGQHPTAARPNASQAASRPASPETASQAHCIDPVDPVRRRVVPSGDRANAVRMPAPRCYPSSGIRTRMPVLSAGHPGRRLAPTAPAWPRCTASRATADARRAAGFGWDACRGPCRRTDRPAPRARSRRGRPPGAHPRSAAGRAFVGIPPRTCSSLPEDRQYGW